MMFVEEMDFFGCKKKGSVIGLKIVEYDVGKIVIFAAHR
jgi:hypothetical protein